MEGYFGRPAFFGTPAQSSKSQSNVNTKCNAMHSKLHNPWNVEFRKFWLKGKRERRVEPITGYLSSSVMPRLSQANMGGCFAKLVQRSKLKQIGNHKQIVLPISDSGRVQQVRVPPPNS